MYNLVVIARYSVRMIVFAILNGFMCIIHNILLMLNIFISVVYISVFKNNTCLLSNKLTLIEHVLALNIFLKWNTTKPQYRSGIIFFWRIVSLSVILHNVLLKEQGPIVIKIVNKYLMMRNGSWCKVFSD